MKVRIWPISGRRFIYIPRPRAGASLKVRRPLKKAMFSVYIPRPRAGASLKARIAMRMRQLQIDIPRPRAGASLKDDILREIIRRLK